MTQEVRISKYMSFKEFNARIFVLADLFGRGIDMARVNVVITYQ